MTSPPRDAPRAPPDARYRMGACHEVVVIDRLSVAERAALPPLAPDEYGVVRTLAISSGVKSAVVVSRDTALLLFTLREPGPLPEYVRRHVGWENDVARLVADGLLEIEHDGAFVSGATAAPLLWQASRPGAARLTALAREALAYAAALRLNDARALGARLYSYHREPLTPARARQLATPAAVGAYLGLDDAAGDIVGRYWIASDSDGGPWRLWRARSRRATRRATHKLYISPQSESLPVVTLAALAALTDTAAIACKIGRDAYGLLRPDKWIAYFDSLDALAAGGDRVYRAIEGAPAHGVPFTAEIAGDGLLSWGMDPPPLAAAQYTGGESWREWVTTRLAHYLLAARETRTLDSVSSDETLAQFALGRLGLDGVDTDSWVPSRSIWVENGTTTP